jgi:SAM-dependent methyltransferase
MYPALDLYRHYKSGFISAEHSPALPDVTKKATLENINFAINLCEKWESVMDIGGGNGHYLAALAAKFKRGVLVEIETFAEHAELVQKRPNIYVAHSPIERYEPGGQTADFILLADLFEHIADIDEFVKKLSSLQTAGGLIYIMTPNPLTCGPAPESGIYHTRHPHGHIKHYTAREIEQKMAKVGYGLELAMYEEGRLRQAAKRIVSGISRRDRRWRNNLAYSLARPLFIPLIRLAFFFTEIAVYHAETRARSNRFATLTQNLVFKKRDDA